MTEVLERWRWYIVALLAVPMLVGVGVLLEGELDGPQPLVIEPAELSTEIRVYVVGAVEAPECTRWKQGRGGWTRWRRRAGRRMRRT